MWLFKKKKNKLPVEYNGIIAEYDKRFKMWTFAYEGIEFCYKNEEFDKDVTIHLGKTLNIIESHKNQISSIVSKYGFKGEELISVDITDYLTEGSFDAAFAGDEHWGDFGINVVFRENEIISDYAGD